VHAALTRPSALLTALIVASTAIRSLVALHHSIPRYFPDELVYTALGRSIAHGHLIIYGKHALFPALIEPILAAPLWGFFPLETAYHLVQVENAIIASLTAIPVYLLSRRLAIASGVSLLCSVYALVTPSLSLTPFTLTDFVGYASVLAAILYAQQSLERPTRRNQAVFVCAAGLATLARTQYFVLVPAYVAAAVLLDRRTMLRRHWIALAAAVPAGVALLVAGTGYFSPTVHHTPLGVRDFGQVGLQFFLMTFVAGIVIVPGAIAALWRPPDRATASFAALTAIYTIILVVEVGVFSADSNDKFRERYLFSIAPLLAISFATYLRRRAPHRWAVFVISVLLAIAAARVPVSAYSTGAARFDSETLIALEWLQKHTAVSSTAFIAAALLTAGGAWATIAALRGGGRLLLPFAIVLALATTIAAAHEDLVSTTHVRARLPRDLEWIDHAARGRPVTAVTTALSDPSTLLLQLYWNPSVKRLLLLDDAYIPVRYSGPRLAPTKSGQLRGSAGLFAFDNEGSQATFWNAQLVESHDPIQLWQTTGGPARFRTLAEGMWSDGWLVTGGRIRGWRSDSRANGAVRLSFTASVPRDWPGAPILFLNGKRWVLSPGHPAKFVCVGRQAADVTYHTPSTITDQTGRPISIHLSRLEAADASGDSTSSRRTTCSL